MTRHSRFTARSRGPAGITLLEVLVACGILVVGLASLASVLPAAGARLSQANVEDRAGIAAANAYAECVARGLVASDLFVSSTTACACAFGRGLENIVPDIVSPKKRRGKNKTAATNPAITQATAALLDRIDDIRGFTLEDDLMFLPSAATDTPVNAFVTTGTLATGHRLSRTGVCWGAMLAATSGTVAAGAEATLSIAVFRKEVDETATLALTQQSGPLFRIASVTTSGRVTDPSPAAAVAARKQLLPGCGYVIAIPTPVQPPLPPNPPKWLRVTSSWTSRDANSPNDTTDYAFVSLDLDGLGDATAQAKYLTGNPATLTVIGFENLVRVDQYTVTLD